MAIYLLIAHLVIVITWDEDIMTDNSPSTRALPEDENIIAIISEVTL